ncbi:MAG: carbamoyltransferase [Bacteroidales bacterium]|nr:carbamoyltransferase [Bacteroidales bacterium]
MDAILGISAYYHDSAAAIIINGEIIAAAQEERFTRKKNDASFPVHAIEYVLNEAGIRENELKAVIFYEKPLLKFERLLETYHSFAPKGLKSFVTSIPIWIKDKVFMKEIIKKELKKLHIAHVPLLFTEHHLAHAASAFYPSPFEEAAIITIDGVGEWATTTIARGKENSIKILKEIHFPHSLGLLYSAFTYYLGFQVNEGEYKLMGLAPYGNPLAEETQWFIDKIKTHLIDIKDDGSFLLNMSYFDYATGLRMTNHKKWEQLFGFPPRKSESQIKQHHCNLALAIQLVTEEIVLKLSATAYQLTHCENLTLAGGVALNSVANGKLQKSKLFKQIWIQPAAGDAGGALGAAYAGYFIGFKKPRKIVFPDAMKGALLGPQFDKKSIEKVIRINNAKATCFENIDELLCLIAKKIAEGNVVGWFQGRMEYGPRALGNRSILADARNPDMQKKLNLKIKFREGFRPFAPSVLEEDAQQYFDIDTSSPYMLLVVPINKEKQNALPDNYNELDLYDKLYYLRSDIPAVTHVDFSARIQTVHKDVNPIYWKLINEFKKITNCSVIVNTSFNVRGEPIVCSPDDAFKCFMQTEMDYLVMENYLFEKNISKDL